jgi:hypothetical protein
LTTSATPRQRLFNQQISRPRATTPGELVRWMGAVQAQDYPGSLWAVGLRLPGAAEGDIEKSLADRTIVRTWPMRGTLHFAPAADVRWMLRLLTPRVVAGCAGRYRQLELDDAAFRRSRKILGRALLGGRMLTRGQAYSALERGGVSPAGQRGIHILGHLAQQGVLCFGPRARAGRQPTFVLLDEWLPSATEPPRDHALATLAERYFASHGPATVQDFAWWSGLRVKDAQEAIEVAGSRLDHETHDGRRRWSAAGRPSAPAKPKRPTAVLLPPWDEYLVAYKDRAATIDPLVGDRTRLEIVGRSLIVIDGRVRGSWRRALTPTTIRVTLDFWTRVTADERRAVGKAAARYARFLGRVVEE